jgi:GMP synthase-like glutamine amidotransferase
MPAQNVSQLLVVQHLEREGPGLLSDALAAHQLLAHAAEPVLEGLPASLACPEQIFRLGPRAFGLQCQIEVDAASLERWIRDDQAFVQAALGPGGAERIRSDGARWLAGATPLWRRLLDNLLVACLA